MVERIRNRITWPLVIGLLIVQAVISAVLFNVGWVPQIEATGAGLLDTQLAYSQDDVYRIMGQYGPEGQALYRRYLLVADYLYGALSGLAFAAFFLMMSKLPTTWAHHLRWLALLPVLMILLDFAENTLLLSLLSLYPEMPAPLISFASLATTLKLLLVNLIFLLILAGLLLTAGVLIGRRRRRAA